MRGAALVAAALALTGCAAQPAPAEELRGTVTVFAAASLTEAFDEIAADFEAANPGVEVVVNYGGSAALAQQIIEGAPADVLAAASPDAMVAAGVDGMTFATNSLEIAVPAGNPGGVEALSDFARPELAIALCAIEVPCGDAAAQALAAAGVAASVDTYEQDVKAVLTKIELDEVDAGLVYRTDVLAAGDSVEGIELPDPQVVAYPIVALTGTDVAAAFVRFVLTDGHSVLRAAGFGAP